MREFSTPVILDQARERAALNGKNKTRFQKLIVTRLIRSFRAERRARVEGEEREILNLSPSPDGFGVISGRAFLHREQVKKQTCAPCSGMQRGVPFVTLCANRLTVWPRGTEGSLHREQVKKQACAPPRGTEGTDR